MVPASRPFLKWAGGKRQLLPALRRFYPEAPGAYFEPFLGSGAVFFDLVERHVIADQSVTLTDANVDLVGCYLRIADALESVLTSLEQLAAGHEQGRASFYLQVRDEHFNPRRAEWRRGGGTAASYPPDLAAMLLYLNRTGYNGLFRLNSHGGFNVPPGRYERPRIIDRPLLGEVSRVLSRASVRIEHAPFNTVVSQAGPGDFVYLNPPYAPMSATANFRSYTASGFDTADQEQLQQAVIALATRGVGVLLSNSTAPDVTRLYERNEEARAAGLRTWRVPARRAINSRASGRGPVAELLVSNLRPRRE